MSITWIRAKTAAEQREREEKARLEAERREREEKERLETERRAVEENARLEAERRQKESQDRLEAEQRQRREKERPESQGCEREERELLQTEPYKEQEINAFFPRIIQNNMVGSKLVSIPWFADASTVTGADYNQLSTAFFQNVNKVLTAGTTAQSAVSQVEKVANRIVR